MDSRAPDGRRDAPDLLDPDERNEERDLRAGARAERRVHRRERQARPGRPLLGTAWGRALVGAVAVLAAATALAS